MSMERKLWELLANQCAPVLTDVKPSNLLILTKEEEQIFLEMDLPEGVHSLCLYRGEKKSTWFLYRKDSLEAVLIWPQAQEFLQNYGYQAEDSTLEEKLGCLTERFTAYKEAKMDFPHEMGVFLGYPLHDVKGFIEHRGQNYICSGYWKVYQNEKKAKKTFQLYQTVRDAVLEMISSGGDLYQFCYQAN